MDNVKYLGTFSGALGGLIADANGDLFDTTSAGGANGDGLAFEIAKTATGFASIPTVVLSFTGANGAFPGGAILFADANGDLFGTTSAGGANGYGTVFEIANDGAVAAPSYAGAPTTLVNFTGANGAVPGSSFIADANGDLFGTTSAGDGTVFEIAKTASGYARRASPPRQLAND